MHISFIPCLSSWRMVFDCGRIHIGFEVDEVAQGQFTLPVFRTSPVTIIPSIFHTRAFCSYQKKKKGGKVRGP
jgi:hypothetical protein